MGSRECSLSEANRRAPAGSSGSRSSPISLTRRVRAIQGMSPPRYILRFDDICPTMNWTLWGDIENILVQRALKPILAVVPDNQDPTLQVDAPVENFWERVREW